MKFLTFPDTIVCPKCGYAIQGLYDRESRTITAKHFLLGCELSETEWTFAPMEIELLPLIESSTSGA